MTDDRAAPRRIVLCVDDVGLHRGVDAALLALHAQRRASAASVLVDGASWPTAAPALRERAGDGLEVGLHVNLSERLRADAFARALPRLLAAAYARALAPATLRAAIARQFDAFEATLRRAPDFVDGHQHVQQLPQVREALLAELAARGGPRPWLRAALLPRWRAGTKPTPAARGKARLVAALGARRLAALAGRAGYATCHALLGVRPLDGDASALDADAAAWLAAATDGDVLMAHPAVAGEAATDDPLRAARAADFALLGSERFGRWLARERITITTMGAIRRPPGGG